MTIQITNRPTSCPFPIHNGDYSCTIRSIGGTWPFGCVDDMYYQPLQISYIGSLWWNDATTDTAMPRPHWGL